MEVVALAQSESGHECARRKEPIQDPISNKLSEAKSDVRASQISCAEPGE
jgi:hypothetical protein